MLSQIRQRRIPISGPLICKSAFQINEILGGSKNFKACDGWLGLFKNPHGLRKRQIHGEKLTTDTDSLIKFRGIYSNFIKEEGYLDENIFSGDKTGLNWKLLCRTALAFGNGDSTRRKNHHGWTETFFLNVTRIILFRMLNLNRNF